MIFQLIVHLILTVTLARIVKTTFAHVARTLTVKTLSHAKMENVRKLAVIIYLVAQMLCVLFPTMEQPVSVNQDTLTFQLQKKDVVSFKSKDLQITLKFLKMFCILVACTQDSHCNNGKTCENNICTCGTDSDCEGKQSCKNGKCQEVTCDNLSCGSHAQCAIADQAAYCECNSGYHAVTDAYDGCGKMVKKLTSKG